MAIFNFIVSVIVTIGMLIWSFQILSSPIQKWLKRNTYLNLRVDKVALLVAIVGLIILCLTGEVPFTIGGLFIVMLFRQYWIA